MKEGMGTWRQGRETKVLDQDYGIDQGSKSYEVWIGGKGWNAERVRVRKWGDGEGVGRTKGKCEKNKKKNGVAEEWRVEMERETGHGREPS
jgi:hypothetical protein